MKNRDAGAKVTMIGDIKFADYTQSEYEPSGMDEIRNTAKSWIKTRNEKLKKAGFKRVELDSYGGYSFRGISKARFVPISTMHSLRFLKK